MLIINATMPRSGSEFVSHLVMSLMGERIERRLSITPGRTINYYVDAGEVLTAEHRADLQQALRNGEELNFFGELDNALVKIESPGRDLLCQDLAVSFKNTRWVCSLRDVASVARSHGRQSWGMSREEVVRAYRNDLSAYQYIQSKTGLFGIDIDAPNDFDLMALARFLNVNEVSSKAHAFSKNWSVTNGTKNGNELRDWVSTDGASLDENQFSIETIRGELVDKHPCLVDIENKMLALARGCESTRDI